MLPLSMRRALVVTALSFVAGCGGEAPRSRPLSALLVTFDTTRADALGCYGNPAGATPHLDALAAEGVRYERAHTVAPLTLPAHTSMMTGLWPPRHGVRDNGLRPLPRAAVTLAERARAAGLSTAAFLGSVVLDPAFGLDQGFERYDAPPRSSARRAERRGHEVVRRALAWLDELPSGARFLLWVHLFDPHDPYDAQPTYAAQVGGHPYLAEVAAADDAFGQLMAGLGERSSRTVVLALGDHGEALGQHGEPTHGSFVYEETLAVPMILRLPGGPRGVRVSAPVSVADVLPTLAAALELPPAADALALDGRALPLSDGQAQPGRGLYFEAWHGYFSYGWSPLAGWLDAGGKSLFASRSVFLDLARDPGETAPLPLEDSPVAAEHEAAVRSVLAAPRLPAEETPLDPGLLADLRAIGYADAGAWDRDLPDPLQPSERRSPTDAAGELQELLRAKALVAAGRTSEAEPALREVLEQNPRNWAALDALGLCLLERQAWAEAREVLQRAVAGGPPWASSRHNLGRALSELGRDAEALDAFRAAIAADPGYRPSVEEALRLAQRLGRSQEAARYEAMLER